MSYAAVNQEKPLPRSRAGFGPPGLLRCQFSQATEGVPSPASPSLPQALPCYQWNTIIQHTGVRPGRIIPAASGRGLGSAGALGDGGSAGRSTPAFPLASPQPSTHGPSCALAAWMGPLNSVSISVSRAVRHHRRRWGHATAQPGVMPLLPRRASSVANACCRQQAGLSQFLF